MGILDNYINRRVEQVIEQRDASITDVAALSALFGWNESGSVANVTPATAEANVAVLGCLRVRGETFASLPCHVYKKNGESREPDTGNPLMDILARNPNPYLTPYQYWEWKQHQEDLHGNSFSNIEKGPGGKPKAFWPMMSDRMTVQYKNRKMLYRYAGDDNNPANDYHPSDILHFKGPFTKDGLPFEGKSLVEKTRETIGLGIASETFFGKLLDNGSHFPTYFEMEAAMNPKSLAEFKAELKKMEGVVQAGHGRAFPPGIHVKQNEMSIKDMDLTPQQRWNLEQMSRIWRVPLPLLNDLTHGTYTNSEQASLWLAQYTMTPICMATEQVLNKQLARTLNEYTKFNMSSLLRGDAATRAAYYDKGINSGWLVRADARSYEDMNPIPGLEKPLVSLAMGTVDADGTTSNPNMILQPVVDNARAQIRSRFERDGDSQSTRRFASIVAEPVLATLRNFGIETDLETFINACKGE
ncbi:MAG: phage portal protein [Actinobacteria bacterium]|nr:phage portal protein [Actinomycetota bacterium]